MPTWIASILGAVLGFVKDLAMLVVPYFFGKRQGRKDAENKETEEVLELKNEYGRIEREENRHRDRGKPGLIDRLRERTNRE